MRVSDRITGFALDSLVVVVDDRLPRAGTIGPDPRSGDRVVRVVRRIAGLQCLRRPGKELDRFLVRIHEVQIADLALRQLHRSIQRQLNHLPLAEFGGLLVDIQQRFQADFFQPQGLFGPPSLGHVRPGAHGVLHGSRLVEQLSRGPGNSPLNSVLGVPMNFLRLGMADRGRFQHQPPHPRLFFGNDQQFAEGLAQDLLARVTRELLAQPIEADDSASAVQDYDQRGRRVEDCRYEIAFVTRRLRFRPTQFLACQRRLQSRAHAS